MLVIDIPARPNRYDEDNKLPVMDLVNYPIGPDSNTPCGAPRELLAPGRARVIRKFPYRIDDSVLLCSVDLSKLLLSDS
jgi:hypothetical protein